METILGNQVKLVLEAEANITLPDFITVRPIKIKQYDAALKFIDDEIGLTAVGSGLDRTAVEQLTPDSYESLRSAVEEVNAKGFFGFAARFQARLAAQLSRMSPELLKLAVEKTSKPSPPGLRPQ